MTHRTHSYTPGSDSLPNSHISREVIGKK